VLEGRHGGAAAVATVVRRSGSAPQIVGATLMMLDDSEQTTLGTVGGGAIELEVLDACRRALRFGRPELIARNLVRDLGMCCGGTMEVFVNYVRARPRLWLVGAGHVSQALAPLATDQGFRVHVLDDREELLKHPAFVDADTAAYDADELEDALPDLRDDDYVVVLTRDHARDQQAVASLLRRPHGYLGMIGSRRKVHAVLARILRRHDERGLERPSLDNLHAPVGLALAGRTPAEIALSIAAELVAHRNGGSGASMSVVAQVLAGLAAREDAG
jgi:xanthine dehydrogenase accessory factor